MLPASRETPGGSATTREQVGLLLWRELPVRQSCSGAERERGGGFILSPLLAPRFGHMVRYAPLNDLCTLQQNKYDVTCDRFFGRRFFLYSS